MAGERYQHIFLKGPTATPRYSNPQRGGSPPNIPTRDRAGHAAFLKKKLAEAWQQAAERLAVAHSQRQGVYLDFYSDPGFDLALKSLEAQRAGIRLLNVRREATSTGEVNPKRP